MGPPKPRPERSVLVHLYGGLFDGLALSVTWGHYAAHLDILVPIAPELCTDSQGFNSYSFQRARYCLESSGRWTFREILP